MGSVGSVIHETEYKILRGTSELHIAVLDPTVRLRILPTKIHYSAQMILDEDLRNVPSSRDARPFLQESYLCVRCAKALLRSWF